jgi:hypothetical protein
METTSPPIFSKKLLVANMCEDVYVFTYEHGVSSFATQVRRVTFAWGKKGRESNTLFFWLPKM